MCLKLDLFRYNFDGEDYDFEERNFNENSIYFLSDESINKLVQTFKNKNYIGNDYLSEKQLNYDDFLYLIYNYDSYSIVIVIKLFDTNEEPCINVNVFFIGNGNNEKYLELTNDLTSAMYYRDTLYCQTQLPCYVLQQCTGIFSYMFENNNIDEIYNNFDFQKYHTPENPFRKSSISYFRIDNAPLSKKIAIYIKHKNNYFLQYYSCLNLKRYDECQSKYELFPIFLSNKIPTKKYRMTSILKTQKKNENNNKIIENYLTFVTLHIEYENVQGDEITKIFENTFITNNLGKSIMFKYMDFRILCSDFRNELKEINKNVIIEYPNYDYIQCMVIFLKRGYKKFSKSIKENSKRLSQYSNYDSTHLLKKYNCDKDGEVALVINHIEESYEHTYELITRGIRMTRKSFFDEINYKGKLDQILDRESLTEIINKAYTKLYELMFD